VQLTATRGSIFLHPANVVDNIRLVHNKAVKIIKSLLRLNRKMPAEVLPIVTPGGPFGTVPELLFEKKGLVPALQQLLVYKR